VPVEIVDLLEMVEIHQVEDEVAPFGGRAASGGLEIGRAHV
jgi:hypothetical protein